MHVTEDDLAYALRTVKIMVTDKDGLADLAGCFPADTLVTRAKGRVWLPEEHAAMLLKKIAEHRAERAVEVAQCRAEGARCDREGGPCTCPCDPEAEAAPIVLKMGDPELSVIGCILAALSDLSPFEPDEVRRVLTYIASRYGYVLATED